VEEAIRCRGWEVWERWDKVRLVVKEVLACVHGVQEAWAAEAGARVQMEKTVSRRVAVVAALA
jgi:hypothetical protein